MGLGKWIGSAMGFMTMGPLGALAGYNATAKTITWVEKRAIDTNKDPVSGNINITKNIKVVYQGISSTTREIENKASATIKTTSETDSVEDTSKTTVSVKGTVIAYYQDTEEKYPESYRIAEDVCESLGKSLGKKLDPIEIGYLAMHIERTVEQ